MKRLAQSAKIIRALRSGSKLTPLDALRRFGCLRLGARIYDLRRDGWAIERRMVDKSGYHVAEYRL